MHVEEDHQRAHNGAGQSPVGATEAGRGHSGAHDGAHDGAHVAAPSAWPFYVAVGALFLFLGLSLLQPVLLVGGLVLLLAALLGWYGDAGLEWRRQELALAGTGLTVGAAPPLGTTWARPFAGFAIAVAAATIMAALVVAAPASRSQATTGGGSGTAVVEGGSVSVAAQAIAFGVHEIDAPAGQAFTIAFTNDDPVPHNIAIFDSPALGKVLFRGDFVTGPGARVTYQVPALAAGTYYFHCDVHPQTMTGTLVVR
jgi:plastocyanin